MRLVTHKKVSFILAERRVKNAKMADVNTTIVSTAQAAPSFIMQCSLLININEKFLLSDVTQLQDNIAGQETNKITYSTSLFWTAAFVAVWHHLARCTPLLDTVLTAPYLHSMTLKHNKHCAIDFYEGERELTWSLWCKTKKLWY